ncbi:MAG TPA: NrfD/PsrC family molybdoenzyme membrane anchor subunit [Candidatus Angelobacter sp.]
MSTDPLVSRAESRVPDESSEARLLEIRTQATQQGMVVQRGVHPEGAPFPMASPETGYYGIHLLKEPQWTPEIPLYLFTGGAAGASAVIGAVADWIGGDRELARHARWLALGGALISSALLISDLGRPSRFLNMLRVFKVQSPMSMGAWTLAAFGGATAASVFAKAAEQRFDGKFPVTVIGNIAQFCSAALGLPLHNYTGVLIGATAIPVWNKNIKTLPIHFGASGVQAGVSMLELMGYNDNRALNLLGIGSALWEVWEGFHLESRDEEELKPLKQGLSGCLTRTGGLMSGPASLVLRLLAALPVSNARVQTFRRAAAMCGIAGSLLTRYGWMSAGRSSARDWRLPLAISSKSPHNEKIQPPAPEVQAAS